MKVALVYDRVNKWGGAERVLLTLHELFPDAPLYTSVYNPQKAPWAKDFTVRTSFLQKFPFASKSHELYAVFMPLAFESFSFDAYDLVISVTSEAAKGIITKPHTRHICYCLTPTRYLWSGYKDYFANKLFRFCTKPIISYLRYWDIIAVKRVDVFSAISQEVQKRVKKYYKVDSTIIYPALNFSPKKTLRKNIKEKISKKTHEPYFLIVSRFVGYKRLDLAIRACNELNLPLKIIGSGIQEKKLKAMAGDSIEFLGNLTDDQIIQYYKSCIAFLFPGKEDFGLTILEAQSLGKPVIAYKAGGALETIIEGKTGEFFTPQTVKALKKKLENFVQTKYNAKNSVAQAKKFRKEIFLREFTKLIKRSI